MNSRLIDTAHTLDSQASGQTSGYTEEERQTLAAAANILREKNRKLSSRGPSDAGGPADELKTR